MARSTEDDSGQDQAPSKSSQGRRSPSPRPRKRGDDNQEHVVSDNQMAAIEDVGENAAPDNPSHLMPSPQANAGQRSVQDESNMSEEGEEDLDAESKANLGYPDPEEADPQSLASTRTRGSMEEQVKERVDLTTHMMEEKLHEITTRSQQEQQVREAEEKGNDEIGDYGSLPGAPQDGIVLGPDEPLRAEGDSDGTVMTLTKAVYRAYRPFRTKRWQFKLEYTKGAQIPESAIRRVNQTTNNDPQAEETK